MKSLLQATESDGEPADIVRDISSLIRSMNGNDLLSSFLRANSWNGETFTVKEDEDEECFIQKLKQFLGSLYLKEISVPVSSPPSPVNTNETNDGEDIVLSFCPDILYSYLRNVQPSSTLEPKTRYFTGVCLFVDVSGFTKLSGQLCGMGISGLDSLQINMRDYIGRVIDIVYCFEGDGKFYECIRVIKLISICNSFLLMYGIVVTTAGDAIICIFRSRKSKFHESFISASNDEENDCLDACLNAINCAREVKWCVTPELSSHMAITSGVMSFAVLGGFEDNWVYILSGDPLVQMSSCLEEAGKQEIVVDQSFYSKVTCSSLFVSEVFEKTGRENFRYIEGDSVVFGKNNTLIQRNYPSLQLDRALLMHRFVPKPVSYALTGCYIDRIAELRDVTTVFINLDNYNTQTYGDPCSLQPFFEMIQRTCSSTGGYMRQFLIDDKGCVAILMWGLPSFSHQNNCFRALKAVSSIQIIGKSMGIQCSIGITVGSCCCGLIGSHHRQDYVVLGASVNLSARLMSRAAGRILVSRDVYTHVPKYSQSLMVQIEDLVLKGHSAPVTTFELPLSKEIFYKIQYSQED